MLHSSLIDTRNELRSSLTEGLDRLLSTGQDAHHEAQDLITNELSKLRAQLRETSNRLLTSNSEVSQDVRQALAPLRQVAVDSKTTHSGLAEEAPVPLAQGDQAISASARSANGPTATAPPAGAWRSSLEPGSELPSWHQANPILPVPESGSPGSSDSEMASSPMTVPAEDVPATTQEMLLHEGLTLLRADLDKTHMQMRDLQEALSTLLALAGNQWQVPGEEAEPQPLPEALRQVPVEEAEVHRDLLKRAAQVSSASLVCHRDIWEFVTGQASGHAHFRMPPEITDRGQDRIAAALSGRSLIAVLISLWDAQYNTREGDADWALSITVYDRIARGLTMLTADGATVTITLDDRASAEKPGSDGQQPPEPDASVAALADRD